MVKGPSEAIFREALTAIDITPKFIYKPPDDARNWKPCDYMLWIPQWLGGAPPQVATSAWFEVKESPNLGSFLLSEIRPSQWRGIVTAKQLGFPYFLAVRWKRNGMWSLVDAVRLADWRHGHGPDPAKVGVVTVSRVALESRFGVSCEPGQLSSMIRAALTEGL